MTGHAVMVGEIVTGLLMHSAALNTADTRTLLDLMPGERVLSQERPVPTVVSPDLVRAVACPMRTASGRSAHGVGTMYSRARVAGGRVVQASTRAMLVPTLIGRRLPWSHYLAAPSTVEIIGWRDTDELADGFITDAVTGPYLQPGAVSETVLARIQASHALDRNPAFRARRTRLRWSATFDAGRARPAGELVLVDETLRTLRIALPADDDLRLEAVAALCEDIALHDWLLTTVTGIAHLIGTAPDDEGAVHRLRPAIDHLLHLWMPGAALSHDASDFAEELDADLGLTRQWQACVDRIRDFMALRALELMISQTKAE
jgi:hypothetical protein